MTRLASVAPSVRPHRGLTQAIRALAHTDGPTARQLAELRRYVAEHVRLTEGHEGLYAEVLDSSPRLARDVRLLVRDHRLLSDAVAVLHDRSGEPASALRRRASDLEALWARHRQRGADLLYTAYAVDIGGET